MYIEQAVRNELVAATGVTALVAAGNIHHVKAPQNISGAYIIIQKISDVPVNSHDGYSNLREARIQITAFSTVYFTTKAINGAVFTALNGFAGVMGGTGGVTVGSCLSDGDLDMYDSEYGLHYCPQDFIISFND